MHNWTSHKIVYSFKMAAKIQNGRRFSFNHKLFLIIRNFFYNSNCKSYELISYESLCRVELLIKLFKIRLELLPHSYIET